MRHPPRTHTALAAAVAAACLASAAAAAPTPTTLPPSLTWASSPALPGDALLLGGARLDAAARVCFQVVRSNADVPPPPGAPSLCAAPQVASSAAVSVVVPPELPPGAVLAVSACASSPADPAGCSSPPVYVNAPEPWWVAGDGEAPPGGCPVAILSGTLRIVGRSLGWTSGSTGAPGSRGGGGGTPFCAPRPPGAPLSPADPALPNITVYVTPFDGGPVTAVPVTGASCHRLDAALPHALRAPGVYTVFLNNGLTTEPLLLPGASPPMFTLAPPPEWPPGTWSPPADCPGDLRGCLAAAAAAGGGTVALPPGVTSVPPAGGALALGHRVQLVGAGAGLSVLQWAAAASGGSGGYGDASVAAPPPPLLTSLTPNATWSVGGVTLRPAGAPGSAAGGVMLIPAGSTGVILEDVAIEAPAGALGAGGTALVIAGTPTAPATHWRLLNVSVTLTGSQAGRTPGGPPAALAMEGTTDGRIDGLTLACGDAGAPTLCWGVTNAVRLVVDGLRATNSSGGAMGTLPGPPGGPTSAPDPPADPVGSTLRGVYVGGVTDARPASGPSAAAAVGGSGAVPPTLLVGGPAPAAALFTGYATAAGADGMSVTVPAAPSVAGGLDPRRLWMGAPITVVDGPGAGAVVRVESWAPTPDGAGVVLTPFFGAGFPVPPVPSGGGGGGGNGSSLLAITADASQLVFEGLALANTSGWVVEGAASDVVVAGVQSAGDPVGVVIAGAALGGSAGAAAAGAAVLPATRVQVAHVTALCGGGLQVRNGGNDAASAPPLNRLCALGPASLVGATGVAVEGTAADVVVGGVLLLGGPCPAGPQPPGFVDVGPNTTGVWVQPVP